MRLAIHWLSNGRRRYSQNVFPCDFVGNESTGEKFIANILREQEPSSPHLYIKGEHKVNAGDIIIDAGVQEGNFALKYVDICSKIYLFECEPDWIEILKQTFRDYHDKVEIIPKFLSDVTDDKNITIDDALPDLRGQKIFLKMDIEGAEPKALRGAKRILTNNRVKASVCAYHNADDCIRIKGIFRKYGYEVSTSDGWMVFVWDPNIFDTADFRKGIVYAENY
ncbi:MAG: FkbM family methyltransferase [Selenomonadaceae bacterium]|nr:FkbM family methyltransferase [Selenomonadaceae bacterium]